jgi:hypothetical protein
MPFDHIFSELYVFVTDFMLPLHPIALFLFRPLKVGDQIIIIVFMTYKLRHLK